MEKQELKICSRCVLDENVPEISFDEAGICNYCKVHDRLAADYPRGEKGKRDFENLLAEIKRRGKGKEYDCVVGVSGGTDSTYLLVLCKQFGLRPLAVNVDNGWHTEIAVNNIKKALDALNYDLVTYVINWEEMKAIHLAFMRASLPWPDGTTDIAIREGLYRTAGKYGIKYIFNGHDFRTEGKQPEEWTWTDGRMINSICRKNGIRLKTFPNQTIFDLVYRGFLSGIKDIRPFWYLEYSKIEARKILEKEVGWEYYGGHHHENIFTRFIIGVWLPQKFGIDKRKVTLSAHVRTGEMTRQEALDKLKEPPYSQKQMDDDKEYVIKKLGITAEEFERIWNSPNKKFTDYPSYFPLFMRMKGLVKFAFSYIIPYKPMMTYEVEKSEKNI